MTPARLAARCLALLGPVPGPFAVVGPEVRGLRAAVAARTRVVGECEPPAAALVTFLGVPARPGERQRSLRALHQRLPVGAPLVLVDHNQPRAWWGRACAWPVLAFRGLGPARARYPVARELAALGFDVESLRLVAGERIQLILARRALRMPGESAPGACRESGN